MSTHDVIIVGAGPSGLSCGIEAAKHNLDYLILEKGTITESIRRFPVNMTFFSTPELLELGGLPFCSNAMRPTRVEALEYYRRVAEFYNLRIALRKQVSSVTRKDDLFVLTTDCGRTYQSKYLVLAIGYFDYPNTLGIEGESLAHVSHYYDEPYRYSSAHVVVVGGGNSAVETALDLYRHNISVSLVHRGSSVGKSVKYWIRPDFDNRVIEGAISSYFDCRVSEIRPGELDIVSAANNEKETLRADFVFLLTGYRPDVSFLEQIGIDVNEENLIPEHYRETRQTNIDRAYIAGSVACGCETGNIFIENGRLHALDIIGDILADKQK